MAKPLEVPIKETLAQLQTLLKKKDNPDHYYKRVEMLILIKKGKILSKNALAAELGVGTKTVHIWRHEYLTNGLTSFLEGNYKGRRSVITEVMRNRIDQHIQNSQVLCYNDLYHVIYEEDKPDVKYDTLKSYIRRKYGKVIEVNIGSKTIYSLCECDSCREMLEQKQLERIERRKNRAS